MADERTIIEHGGWQRHGVYVMRELEAAQKRDQALLEDLRQLNRDFDKAVAELKEHINTNKVTLGELKVKCGLVGLLAGAIPPAIAYLVRLVN